MKSLKHTIIIMTIVVFTLIAGTTYGQASATASAAATIVAPIGITNSQDMNFGNIAVTTSLGTVVLAPAGTRTTTGGVTLPGTTGIVQAATFAVTGEGSYTYAITLPSGSHTITHSGGVETMQVNSFTSSPSGTGQLLLGSQTLTVGATLNVAGSQLAGTYISGANFLVTVNYN